MSHKPHLYETTYPDLEHLHGKKSRLRPPFQCEFNRDPNQIRVLCKWGLPYSLLFSRLAYFTNNSSRSIFHETMKTHPSCAKESCDHTQFSWLSSNFAKYAPTITSYTVVTTKLLLYCSTKCMVISYHTVDCCGTTLSTA